MQLFVPIGGGGISLIFLLLVPILISLGTILMTFYWYFIRELKSQKAKDISFFFMLQLWSV